MSYDNFPASPSSYSALLRQYIRHRDLLHGRALHRVAVADALAEKGGVGGGGGELVAGHAVEDDEGFAETGREGERRGGVRGDVSFPVVGRILLD
ncbi:hypothetical protein QJS10_CPA08g01628 [Acorus calamus]|uniref:Uncharacterized protein n=1 Tax=Acorus calamus TaxID=4465 RepID=A0AAV9EE81_ACOCL|nr:hypothetical protein QJS10_CPA08g01628 [Acorus calamus]